MEIDKFRFAIGDDRAAVATEWIAWADRDSFYLGALRLDGLVKLSLHEKQICRLAIPKQNWLEHREGAYRSVSDRAFQQWTRAPTPEQGVLHVASIAFPTDFMVAPLRPSRAKPSKPLFMIPMAAAGMCVEISLLYSLQHPKGLEGKLEGKCTPIVYMTLTTGEFVSVVGRNAPFDPSLIPAPDQWARGAQVLDEETWRNPPSTLAALLSNDPREGDGVLRLAHISGFAFRRGDPASSGS